MAIRIVGFAMALIALVMSANTCLTSRKRLERARQMAYVEGVRYGLAQRRHEWYAGYKQGLREGGRRT